MSRAGIVVVGAGVAGHAAVEAARAAGYDRPIRMVGAESLPPFDRPALSKAFLANDSALDALCLWPHARFDELGIDLILSERVVDVDHEAGVARLEAGRELTFDKLLIATGVAARTLSVPGAEIAGVVALRGAADAVALRARLTTGTRVAIVGAGFIGTEVAASARRRGCEVTLIDALSQPLEAVLGPEVGREIADLHREHGVRLLLRTTVAEVRGRGRVEALVLDDGELLPCDIALIAVGVVPDDELVPGAERGPSGGIAIDDSCRTTLPGILAAGDVTSWRHPLSERPLHVEHFETAVEQGAVAGRAIAGITDRRHSLPRFWSDQYDTTMLWTGLPEPWDEVVLRRDEGRLLTAFYVVGGVVRAVATTEGPRALRAARKLIEGSVTVTARRLADPATDLASLP